VLYVDLVGSTTMTLEMPAEKIAIIISPYLVYFCIALGI